MKETAFEQATGRTKSEWFDIIHGAEKTAASHKEIADFLHETHGVPHWWAQEITVEYEKHTGRRVLGQTQDGLFQIGVSRTINASAARLWDLLQSAPAISLLTSIPDAQLPAELPDEDPAASRGLQALEVESASGITAATTTFEAGSHVRMRWQRPEWPSYSILQIRLTAKSAAKTTLSFHQEKLPSRKDREIMQEHWRRVADRIAAMESASEQG